MSFAVCIDLMDARVGGLMDDVRDGRDGPELRARTLLPATVAEARRRDAEIIQAFGFCVERGAFGNAFDLRGPRFTPKATYSS